MTELSARFSCVQLYPTTCEDVECIWKDPRIWLRKHTISSLSCDMWMHSRGTRHTFFPRLTISSSKHFSWIDRHRDHLLLNHVQIIIFSLLWRSQCTGIHLFAADELERSSERRLVY